MFNVKRVKMKKLKSVILISSLVLLSTGCSHRGLELSEQIPEKFLEEYRKNGFDQETDQIIGFVEQGDAVREENIIFIDESQALLFNEKKNEASANVVMTDAHGYVFGSLNLSGFENGQQKVAVESYDEKPSSVIADTEASLAPYSNPTIASSNKKEPEVNKIESPLIEFNLVSEKSDLTIDGESLGVVFYSN